MRINTTTMLNRKEFAIFNQNEFFTFGNILDGNVVVIVTHIWVGNNSATEILTIEGKGTTTGA